jgi:hypothetical protein
MSSILKVDTIQDQSGNNIINENADTITIGASGDTISIPSGATIDASGATLTLPTTIEVDTIEPQSGTSLTIGASGDTITIPSGATITNSGTATGFGGGKVLQVITATDSTLRTTTSTSFVTGSNTLSVSITPSSASNKIFVIVSANIVNGSGDGIVFATIFRGATNLGEATNGMAMGNSVSGITPIDHPASITILDSPSSTSALTYQLYFRSNNVSYTASLNGRGGTVTKSSITAFEIAG